MRDGIGAPLRGVRLAELRELAGELRCVCGVAASVAKLAAAHARLDEAPLSLLQLASLLRLGTAAAGLERGMSTLCLGGAAADSRQRLTEG